MKAMNRCWEEGVTFFRGVATSKLPTLQQTTAPSILMQATLITRSGAPQEDVGVNGQLQWESVGQKTDKTGEQRRNNENKYIQI